MALSDKDIIINPNNGSASADPNIVFSGADAEVGPQNITVTAQTLNNGTLRFTGSEGTLLSIDRDGQGSVLSITDISGIPNIEINSDGQVILVPSRGIFNYDRCPAFKVENTTSSSAFAANSDATWNNISYNNGGHFANNRFTAPWRGIYFFSCMILSNQNTRLFHNFRVNGSDISGTYSETYAGSQFQTATISMVYELYAGDFVQVRVRDNAAYGANYANFNGFQVG